MLYLLRMLRKLSYFRKMNDCSQLNFSKQHGVNLPKMTMKSIESAKNIKELILNFDIRM